MRFIRRDDTPDDYALINVDQVTRVQVRNEKRPDALQVDVYLTDGRKRRSGASGVNGCSAI